MNPLNRIVLLAGLTLGAAACATKAPPAPAPAPTAPAPTPEPKPNGVVPAVISQDEAEQLCTLKATKKFGVGISDVKVVGTSKVDAGYRTKLMVGGQEKTCIITPQGDLRSLI